MFNQPCTKMYEEVPTQVNMNRIWLLLGLGVVLAITAGCGASSEPLQGQEKADMEKFLKEGIPASKSPGATPSQSAPPASSTPAGVPTDG